MGEEFTVQAGLAAEAGEFGCVVLYVRTSGATSESEFIEAVTSGPWNGPLDACRPAPGEPNEAPRETYVVEARSEDPSLGGYVSDTHDGVDLPAGEAAVPYGGPVERVPSPTGATREEEAAAERPLDRVGYRSQPGFRWRADWLDAAFDEEYGDESRNPDRRDWDDLCVDSGVDDFRRPAWVGDVGPESWIAAAVTMFAAHPWLLMRAYGLLGDSGATDAELVAEDDAAPDEVLADLAEGVRSVPDAFARKGALDAVLRVIAEGGVGTADHLRKVIGDWGILSLTPAVIDRAIDDAVSHGLLCQAENAWGDCLYFPTEAGLAAIARIGLVRKVHRRSPPPSH